MDIWHGMKENTLRLKNALIKYADNNSLEGVVEEDGQRMSKHGESVSTAQSLESHRKNFGKMFNNPQS